LVLKIGQLSQKDPKEYIPFLLNLKNMDKYVQRYTIDIHLKRWELALENIKILNDEKVFEEVGLKVIEENNLFKYALNLFGKDNNQILNLYAKQLHKEMNYKEAAYCNH
jgi:elongator complex protein 1